MLTFGAGWCNIHLFAEMAELADAHGSGPCGSDTMRVQVPLSALQGGDHKRIIKVVEGLPNLLRVFREGFA